MSDDDPTDGTYLVYCLTPGLWWRSNNAGYTNDVWTAGRYTYAEAVYACSGRQLEPLGEGDVIVRPPEHGRPTFTVAEILDVPRLMRNRISEAVHVDFAARQEAAAR